MEIGTTETPTPRFSGARDGPGDRCRALVATILRFDLTPLRDLRKVWPARPGS